MRIGQESNAILYWSIRTVKEAFKQSTPNVDWTRKIEMRYPSLITPSLQIISSFNIINLTEVKEEQAPFSVFYLLLNFL